MLKTSRPSTEGSFGKRAKFPSKEPPSDAVAVDT